MKVLFAVSNESISEAIVKKYQKDYKEIISYKNVYYFNAILKEIERDKSYDRIVISEDLEPFANNNYETIDRFLFERLDGISDEASNGEGVDIPIILICTDRRAKSDALLLKLFSIGIYNAMLGQDRSIDEVCNLINKPRTKKDAKIYYKIEADDASYQAESEENVSEAEIQNIIAHYKKLGKNSDRFVDSFNNIAAQYTDQQLKVIIKFLPLNVKAVLEAESERYQEIMTFGNDKKKKKVVQARVKPSAGGSTTKRTAKAPKLEDVKIDLLENQSTGGLGYKTNVVVPTAVNVKKVKKTAVEQTDTVDLDELQTLKPISIDANETEKIKDEKPEEPVKRGRGRPKKVVSEEEKIEQEQKPKRGRGRPKKVVEEPKFEEAEQIELPTAELEEEKEEIVDTVKAEDIQPLDLFNLSEEDEVEQRDELPKFNKFEETNERQMIDQNEDLEGIDLGSVLTKNKKVVAFVGAPKNGTSFIINNLAFLFSQMGINTAILDVTQNKNSYYIYTKNEENLRKTAFESMNRLKQGMADGIVVNKNLTVYTSLPGSYQEQDGVSNILSTLAKKHMLVLIDSDFDTNMQYFASAQEVYLVQSMDILTIQPLTAFLRDLKTKNILRPEKLRVVINKELKVKGLNPKVLIGGMSFYNEPAMTFMTELFDKDKIKFSSIPFEIENYAKYLEALVDCHISVNAYTKTFIANLKSLANMVYPLLARQPYESTEIGNNYASNTPGTKVKKLFNFNK